MFNKKLKELRLAKGLTQRKIADILNLSVTGYASWEQGISQPNIDFILKLSKILDTTPNELLEYGQENNININNSFNHNKGKISFKG